MSRDIFKVMRLIFTVIIFTGMFYSSVEAKSLYEFYTNATEETLKGETKEMSRNLKHVFKEESINRAHRKIDFSQYYSSLKKLVVYASKLTTYSEYERDLQFAKDNEIFKGLPEIAEKRSNNDLKPNLKDFASKKYDRMKSNVEEEIETYEDLIMIALDSCESLSQNDLSGFTADENNREEINEYMNSEIFRNFQVKQSRFSSKWPELNSRISAQLALWEKKELSGDTPIINPIITGAI